MLNKKRLIKIGMISAPIIVSVAAIGVFFAFKQKNSHTVERREDSTTSFVEVAEENSNNSIKVFPDLTGYDFYNLLKVNEDGAYFTDEFKASVITKVITDMKYTSGKVYWDLSMPSNNVLMASFMWKAEGSAENRANKTYIFTLSTN